MHDTFLPALIVLLLFITGSVFVDKALKKIAMHYDASTSELFRLISNSQRAIFLFVGVVLALSKLGFNVSALVAGLGLTGFAVGFALKDAISNLVAGIMIVLYKPIELHDLIEVASTKGKVADINLRYITIVSDEVTHLIPNSIFLNNKVSLFKDKAVL